MAIHNIDGILNYLEKKAEDELELLESTGPEFFSTADLLRLRGQWEIKHLLFGQLQRLLIYIAAASQKSLGIMLTIAAIGALLVLSYTAFVFRTFRGKVQLDETSY